MLNQEEGEEEVSCCPGFYMHTKIVKCIQHIASSAVQHLPTLIVDPAVCLPQIIRYLIFDSHRKAHGHSKRKRADHGWLTIDKTSFSMLT